MGGRGAVGGIESHDLEVPDPVLLPFAAGSFDSIGPLARADFPHRHTFYEVAYVSRGSGVHTVDLVDYPLRPPNLYVIAPGQVHHWAGAGGVAGWVLLFTEDFLLRYPEDVGLLRRLVASQGGRTALEGLLAEVAEEYRGAGPGRLGVLQALVRAVRGVEARVRERVGPGGRAAVLAGRFERLVDGALGPEWTVESAARELGVSAGHLHGAVKEWTGRTPAQLIRGRRILEAKRLLAATGLTVRQVGAVVGFEDPAYFCRFFRREVGRTPGEYRAEVGGGMHHEGAAESIDRAAGRP
ncbi:AraC family transcriptional regulator [Kitasatospora terrestris]|uniref:AraC family transcriptional regulator n=1 Tax=Kitasatospora terrestris TaxID=258051 RepID=A0ABP9ECH8_9ACTN